MGIAIEWRQLSGAVAVLAAMNGAYVWVLYHVLRDKMDGVYMKRDDCDANHKVTDMAIVGMRDDIREMKVTNHQILKVLLEARGVFSGENKPSRRTRKGS